MAKEIEFRYLANSIPESLLKHPAKLSQGYIHVEKTKQVRVRVDWMYRKAWMCIKFMDGNKRDEFEVEMDFQEACELLALCKYKVSKNRYGIVHGELKICFDQYENGTIILEVECPERHMHNPLGWFPEKWRLHVGRNIDGQYEYTNYYFAGIPEGEYK